MEPVHREHVRRSSPAASSLQTFSCIRILTHPETHSNVIVKKSTRPSHERSPLLYDMEMMNASSLKELEAQKTRELKEIQQYQASAVEASLKKRY